MGQSAVLAGHVESIAAGIEDRERTVGNGLLANINPTFNWVRLAQRVPVRIAFDHGAGRCPPRRRPDRDGRRRQLSEPGEMSKTPPGELVGSSPGGAVAPVA